MRAELARKSAGFANSFHWDILKEELFKVIDDWPPKAHEAAT
jgi:hypothetical protein